MATIAAGNHVEVYVPLAGDITITPGTGGYVEFGCSSPSGESAPEGRRLYAAAAIAIPAGSTMFLRAEGEDATYTDPATAGGVVTAYTAAQLSAMAAAGTLTPYATYVANDVFPAQEQWARDASTLELRDNATYPPAFSPFESTSYFGTSVNIIDGSHTSLVPPDGGDLNGIASVIGNGGQFNALPLAATVSITGSITGDVLTVSAVGTATNPNGTHPTASVMRGHYITGHAEIPADTYIIFDPTDTGDGGTGTYKLSAAATGAGVPSGTVMSLTCINGVGGVLTRVQDPFIGPNTSENATPKYCWQLTILPTHRVSFGHGRAMIQMSPLTLRRRYRIEALVHFYDHATGAWHASNSTTAEPQMLIASLTQLAGSDYDTTDSMGNGVQFADNGPFAINYSRGALKVVVRPPSEQFARLDADGFWSWDDGDRASYFNPATYEYPLRGNDPVLIEQEFFLDERAISEGGKGWMKVWINRELIVDYVGRVCYPAGRLTGKVGQIVPRIGMYDVTYPIVADNTLCSAVRSTATQRTLSIKHYSVKMVG